jgi:thioredoxin 1
VAASRLRWERKESIMSVTRVTDESFEKDILTMDKLVLVDFGATWCGPCKALEPVLAELANEYAGKVVIARCDIEEAPQTAQKFGVFSVPTVVFLKDGKEIHRFVGAERKDKIARQIDERLNSSS